jgi:hypothetical protein
MTVLDTQNISLEKSHGDAVSIRLADGQVYQDVAFVQLFPHSYPVRYISVLQKKGADYIEIGIIKDVNALPENAQSLVLEDIRRRYFLPLITDILSIKTRSGTDTWIVETDKGQKTFTVRERNENVTMTDQGVVLVTDIDKCRYKITDIGALSPKARVLLEKVLM